MLRYSNLSLGITQRDIYQPWMLLRATQSGGVRNVSLRAFRQMAALPDGKLRLDDIVLFMYGTMPDGKKAGWIVRILEGSENLLEGKHAVCIAGGDIQQVASLHYWRRHCFGIRDKLSFERSTFAIFPESKQLVRLKNFRILCTLPGCSVSTSIGISRRTKQQLENEVTRLYHAYARDRMDRNPADIAMELEHDFKEVLKQIQSYAPQSQTVEAVDVLDDYVPMDIDCDEYLFESVFDYNHADWKSRTPGEEHQELLAVSHPTNDGAAEHLPRTDPQPWQIWPSHSPK